MNRKKLWLKGGTVSLAIVMVALGTIMPAAPVSAATTPNLKVAFIGDQGLGSNPTAVLNLVKNEGAQALFHPGDFDYADNPTAWDNQMTNTLGLNFLVFGTVGNHDVTQWNGYKSVLQRRLNANPDAVCVGDLGVKASCHWQGLFFILSGVGTLGTGHETYIQSELANDNSVWSICLWHKNQQAMQIGGKTNEVGWGAYENCRIGGAIIATAHEHSYERTRTLTSMTNQVVDPAWPDANNLRVAAGSTFAFVSGLAGNSIRDQSRCLPATYPYGCNGEWASIQASNQGANYGALFCTFSPGGVENQANCYFKDIQGRTLDTFTVTSQMGGGPPPAACADSVDNDGDSLIDYPADPGCTSSSDNDETNAPPPAQCQDGIDNDGDSLVDYPADPGCTGATDNDETNAGGGVSVVDTKNGGSTSSSTVATSAAVTAASGHLYLATVSTKGNPDVTGVNGMGLTWTQLDQQCGGRGQTRTEVWYAVGTSGSTSGVVTATAASAPSAMVISVTRFSGVNGATPIGAVNSANTLGVNGACSGGSDANSYSVPITTQASGSMLYGSVGLRQRSHTAGSGFTEITEFHAGSGGNAAGVATERKTLGAPGAQTVTGTFGNTLDWSGIAVEIRA